MQQDTTFDGNTIIAGQLEIDHDKGIITFVSAGVRILRITHLKHPIPRGLMHVDVATVSQLVSFTDLDGGKPDVIDGRLEQPAETDADGNIPTDTPPYWDPPDGRPAEEAPPLGPDRRCSTCGKVHQLHMHLAVRASAGKYLWPNHEYIIITKTSGQKYQRSWRMGFLGKGQAPNQLEFSARGPDRTHGGQYGGTQVLAAGEIIDIQQVPRDDKLRHTARQVRP